MVLGCVCTYVYVLDIHVYLILVCVCRHGRCIFINSRVTRFRLSLDLPFLDDV